MLRKLGLILVVAATLACSQAVAFRSTNVEGYTDPDFVGYKPSKVVLLVVGADTESRQIIEERAVEKLDDYGVEVFTERSLFPPTREWTTEMRAEILKQRAIDSTLVIAAGANSSQVIPFARQTFGTANTTGQVQSNGNFSANTSSNSTSYNLVIARSSAEFSAVLSQAETGRTVWYGDVLTKARGTLFVGSKGDAKASVNGVLEGLEEAGHISPPSRRR